MSSLNSIHLKSSVRSVRNLTDQEKHDMYVLMSASYEAVPRARFESDLSRKDEVLILLDQDECLRGFTTLAWNPGGRFEEGDILFSGDTIIDRSCWGTQELVRAFCRRAGEWKAANQRRLFWFLISKGHRTYLYLPLFAKCFHPHPTVAEPEFATLAARVAAGLFGDSWKPDEGLIRFSSSQGHLNECLAASSLERQKNPWVNYFLEQNPNYHHGDELVCLTEMSEANLQRGALKAFREGMNNRTD